MALAVAPEVPERRRGRARRAALVPAASGGWPAVDLPLLGGALPSRVRGATAGAGAGAWPGPGDERVPGFCAALATRRCGFRLGLRTGLADGLVQAWGLVPEAVDERRGADGLLAGETGGRRLTDRGAEAAPWAPRWAAAPGVTLLAATAPDHRERRRRPRRWAARAFDAAFRTRSETTTGRLTGRFHLDAHRANRCRGRRTRVAAKLAAHPSATRWRPDLLPPDEPPLRAGARERRTQHTAPMRRSS